jgi:hypothetical protein
MTNSVTIERPAPLPNIHDAARGIAAAREGVALARAAASLYEAGGREILGISAQAALRGAAEKAAGNVLGAGATTLLREGAEQVAKSTAREVMKSAGRQIAKGLGKAAGLGFVIDGGIAAFEAVRAVRRGDMTRPEAIEHVGKEAVSGAVATAAGTLACVGLVALTGPLSMPALVVCGAGASLGTKTVLRRWMKRKR